AIAGYYSIMRLDLSHLPCVKPDHYIKRNGISYIIQCNYIGHLKPQVGRMQTINPPKYWLI
ncbi:hypothetical protein, partial [Psychromonas hadalis]|uniref:hypothetical protein n=1 Tax=Psychromonas hadalis TaxID=211669 RepID=UPI0005240CA8